MEVTGTKGVTEGSLENLPSVQMLFAPFCKAGPSIAV
jgi:hypothetical protein